MKTTLVAVSGMSPAIITETIWALAQERPSVVPDDIVVITTEKGENDIHQHLLAPRADWGGKSPWECLRASILADSGRSGKLQLSIRVIEVPDESTGIRRKAPDLRTRQENDVAADYIIQALSPLADAEDNRLIASIAGGRKTMGALLYAAMSLLGKEQDRVTHVLVSEPYETCRDFFYPTQPTEKLSARNSTGDIVQLAPQDAVIELADIAFVPLRNRFAELNEPRRTFAGLVEKYSRARDGVLPGPPRVEFDGEAATLTVNGRTLHLKGRDVIVAGFLYERAVAGLAHFPDRRDAEEPLQIYEQQWKAAHPTSRAHSRRSSALSEDDLSKSLASLRKNLCEIGLESAIIYLAPERQRIGFEIRQSS